MKAIAITVSVILLTGLAAVLLPTPERTHACSYPPDAARGPDDDALDRYRYDVIFTGAISAITALPDTGFDAFEVDVDTVYKGRLAPITYVMDDATSCGINADVGERFLFYAREYAGEDWHLHGLRTGSTYFGPSEHLEGGEVIPDSRLLGQGYPPDPTEYDYKPRALMELEGPMAGDDEPRPSWLHRFHSLVVALLAVVFAWLPR